MTNIKKILLVSKNSKLINVLPCCNYEVKSVLPDEDFYDYVNNFNMVIMGYDINVLKSIRKHSDVPVIIISENNDKNMVLALNNGADDYIPTPYILPNLLARMAAILRRTTSPSLKVSDGTNKINTLTKREKDVLLLVKRGESNKSIAKKLTLSEITVKSHLSNIYKKLNVSNRTQALLSITNSD